MRRILIAIAIAASTTVPAANADIDGTPVEFAVSNVHTLASATIHGTRFDPGCASTSAIVLMHGLSYTRAAWNVPGYSVVEPLLEAGITVFTIDRLGYGESTLANGYDVSSEAHAHIAAQIVQQLRGSFTQVVLAGHSAGAEAAILSAGMFADTDPMGARGFLLGEEFGSAPDAVAALGYHHVPSPEIVQDFFTGDYVRAAQDDYEYFLGTPQHRAEMFFTDAAEGEVIEADAVAAVLTPSGEVYSIGKQPSRVAATRVNVPVFLQFGDSDRLFPVEYADEDALLFASAPSVTVDIVPSAGHTFMLHPTGPAGSQRLADWVSATVETCA